MVQHLEDVENFQIGACKKVSLDTKLEMQNLISESAEATTSAKKRGSDAGLVVKGLVGAAAAEALSKRPRPSASTGPVVGALAAAFGAGADATASTSGANMIHREGLPDGFLQKPSVLAFLKDYKKTSVKYEPPGSKAVSGPLLNELHKEYKTHGLKRIDQYKESFGLAVVSDGATVNRTALINILAVVMSIALSESALGERLRLFRNSAFRNYERNATSP